jgi:hypothetical protein
MTIDECFQAIDKGEGLFFYPDDIKEILQRFALEFVTSCLPVEMKMTLVRGTVDPDDYYRDEYYVDGFNYCRTATLEAARKILGV